MGWVGMSYTDMELSKRDSRAIINLSNSWNPINIYLVKNNQRLFRIKYYRMDMMAGAMGHYV